MYILKADYKNRITSDLLEKIIAEGNDGGANTILDDIGRIAEDTLRSTVGVLYDVSQELAKAGSARNFLLVNWALCICTYQLYQRIDSDQVPEKVVKNYDDCIDDLIKVSNGKFPLALPPKPATPLGGGEEGVDGDGAGLRRMGSRKPRTHAM
jgi:hypothetical protein